MKWKWKPKKPKPKPKPPTHTTRYNIYRYNEAGLARKVGTRNDYQEAKSFVSNQKAVRPNVKYKIVATKKKRGW